MSSCANHLLCHPRRRRFSFPPLPILPGVQIPGLAATGRHKWPVSHFLFVTTESCCGFFRGYGINKCLSFCRLKPEVAELGHDRLIVDQGSVPHHCVQQARRFVGSVNS
jgi:hypothetical protein